MALAALAPSFAHPGVLYKAVDANGTVIFSDTPPPGARIVEERETSAVSSLSGAPQVTSGPGSNAVLNAEQMLALDPQVAQANANVDTAERELAAARRELAPLFEGARLRPTRLTMDDDARLEPYRKNLQIARQHLCEILRDRRITAAAPMVPGAPIVSAPSRVALR